MKILIIRFSSFGDVLQTLSVAGLLRMQFPTAEIHWVTREEFKGLIETHPAVTKVWTLSRSQKLAGLWQLGSELKKQRFTHVYDAHNNLRSHFLGWRLKGFADWRSWTGQIVFLRRCIYRFRRFMLFRFRRNLFPRPFSGQQALLEPLKKWGLPLRAPSAPQLFISEAIRVAVRAQYPALADKRFLALAASAAFPLKRWPVDYWKRLILLAKDEHFVLLGGPEDQFLAEIEAAAPERVLNLAGKLSLVESAAVVELSHGLIANDTGLMHVAEQIGRSCVALMGPAPFGFPSRPTTRILEISLACRPCSKHGQGPCINPEFQKCLRDIAPEHVLREMAGLEACR
jgi:lipopolysaccharide heptosyltransferase II